MTTPARRPSRPRHPHPPRRRRGPASPPVEDPARQAALDTLRAVRDRDAYANLVLPALLRQRRITGRDAALATELAYGACRAQGLLDQVLAACCDRPLDTVDGPALDALRLGSYQLLRTRIPPHAAVAATVDVARATAGSPIAGFVNAVLRRVAEHDADTWVRRLAPDPVTDPVGHAAFASAHPRWIAEAFAAALAGPEPEPDAASDPGTGTAAGVAELAAALAADDARPAVHLTARPGVLTAAELAALTGGEVAPYGPYGVRLEPGAGDPGELDPVRDGMAAVQDEGSQLCALALVNAPLDGPDRRWLDLCAGPGGKAVLLGALAGLSGGTLDAVEPVPHRADLVRAATAGLPVTVHQADGRDPGLGAGRYDRVLVDAPCSGLGALRRRPEARWRRGPQEVPQLVARQRDLLHAALRLVRPGGVVAYVVCTPHLPETVEPVTAVVAATGAEWLDARPLFPGVPDLGDGPHVQLWPHRQGTDAMFAALLRRPT